MMHPFATWLQTRIGQSLPGYEAQLRMTRHLHRPQASEAPAHARESSVLILLFRENDEIKVLLIIRTKDGSAHSGQIAFPGGKKEDTDADEYDTAFREAEEEIYLARTSVSVIGKMSALYIPVSNFIVQPVLAYTEQLPDSLKASEYEVADILKLSLRELFDSKGDTEILIDRPVSGKIKTIAYILNESIIVWGATAMILSELEALWDEFHQLFPGTGK